MLEKILDYLSDDDKYSEYSDEQLKQILKSRAKRKTGCAYKDTYRRMVLASNIDSMNREELIKRLELIDD